MPSDSDITTVLPYLERLAQWGGGYQLRGAYGWAHLSDLQVRLRRRFPECLPRLHQQGLLDRLDVALPGKRPNYVYRITNSGAEAAATIGGYSYQPVAPPGPADEVACFLLSPACALALRVLRQAYEEQPDREEGGWLTGRELDERCYDSTGSGDPLRIADWESLNHLRTLGYVERPSAATTRTVRWRITASGLRAPVLVWHDPQPAAVR
jgi:DNA-binding PadR family transcriptional regulator